jgi:hypothetical protein
MKIGRWIVAALLLGVRAWGALRVWQRRAPVTRAATSAEESALVRDSLAQAPPGQRVRVQVVNATKVRGLARRATRWLRDRGFDVVEVGTTSQQLESTLVLDRSGHPDWARRAARAMGGARVEARADSLRYLDLTVLVGRTWRPPTQTLDP